MNNPFEMVFGIVLVVMVAQVLKARYRSKNGVIADKHGNEKAINAGDNTRMKDEIVVLKDRIAVLERIATDERTSKSLELEIEELRDQ